MTFAWETGTPKERADCVRGHVRACFNNGALLCELFHLSEAGLICILAGYKWWPEFDAIYSSSAKDKT